MRLHQVYGPLGECLLLHVCKARLSSPPFFFCYKSRQYQIHTLFAMSLKRLSLLPSTHAKPFQSEGILVDASTTVSSTISLVWIATRFPTPSRTGLQSSWNEDRVFSTSLQNALLVPDFCSWWSFSSVGLSLTSNSWIILESSGPPPSIFSKLMDSPWDKLCLLPL